MVPSSLMKLSPYWGGLDLGRILFADVPHLEDVLVAVEGVAVDRHLPIESHHLLIGGNHQRVDLDQVGVEVDGGGRHGGDEALAVSIGHPAEAQLPGQCVCLERQ